MAETDNIQNREDDSVDEQTFFATPSELMRYVEDTDTIKFTKKYFPRMSCDSAGILCREIIRNNIKIHISTLAKKYNGLYNYNMTKFDKDKYLLPDIIRDFRNKLIRFIQLHFGDLTEYNTDDDEEENDSIKNEKKSKKQSQNGVLHLKQTTSYKQVIQKVCDELGDVEFKYNFNKPDMEIKLLENINTLQRCRIHILTPPIIFDYPIKFSYICPSCGTQTEQKAYEVESTLNKVKCHGLDNTIPSSDGTFKSRMCGEKLSPSPQSSTTKNAYYYTISYEDNNGSKNVAGAISFNQYNPGFYETVLFKIKNPKKPTSCFIMDINPIKTNKFIFPEAKINENYLITLQEAFDVYIKNQTNMEIYGLRPVKIALLIQKLYQVLGLPLVSNIQITGSAATGKSTVLKYWGYLLHSHKHMTTNGMSISIPALRGTKETITLLGKDHKIITTGYLGTFDSIHIDEAGENRELVQNLKTFLCEENYGYDKAGATGIFHKRTAQINLSENLNNTHLNIYRSTIKKAYKDPNYILQDDDGNDVIKLDWNEDWDLHQPIGSYTDNIYLYNCVKEQRTKLKLSLIFWIDGYDYALHERFPLYFYLVNDNENEKLHEVVKGNIKRNTIRENLELIRALKSNDIDNFFNSLKEYIESDNDIEAFAKVDSILERYKIDLDPRVTSYFYNLIKVSRIINKRFEYIDEDFKLLQWFLEKINCKIDVTDTVDYEVNGPIKTDNIENIKPTTQENIGGSFGSETNIEDDFDLYQKSFLN